jgi:hypothetical protein
MDDIINILKKELKKIDPEKKISEDLLDKIYSIEKKDSDSPSKNKIDKINAIKDAVEESIGE